MFPSRNRFTSIQLACENNQLSECRYTFKPVSLSGMKLSRRDLGFYHMEARHKSIVQTLPLLKTDTTELA